MVGVANVRGGYLTKVLIIFLEQPLTFAQLILI